MPTRIRLQRKGKKGQPFYHLVVADGRAPRDGKFIERLGTYNPMTHPATIDINFDRALYWVQVGAQPTDTARSILSHKGVFLKHHLLKGVNKGALTVEQVEEKFQTWLKEKEEKLVRVSKEKELTDKEQAKKQLEYEKKIDEARASELAKKRNAALAEKSRSPVAETSPPVENETTTTEVSEAVAEPEASAMIDDQTSAQEDTEPTADIKDAEEPASEEDKKPE
jgi:small subunit ribosomal protein S16